MTETTALDLLAKRVRHLETLEAPAAGIAGGGLPAVAGVGYALVSDAVNSWIADQTPLWTGEHSFEAGVAFTGASDANEIIIPDDTAIALELLDTGGLEYLRIVSTDANPYFLIDPGAVGIKAGIGVPDPDGAMEVHTAAYTELFITSERDDGPLGVIRFQAEDDVGADVVYGAIVSFINDGSAGAEQAELRFYAMEDGAATQIVTIGPTTCQMEIVQDAAGGANAVPVLALQQDDISEGFINFIGSDRGVIGEGTNSVGSVRAEINGTIYRLALYANG